VRKVLHLEKVEVRSENGISSMMKNVNIVCSLVTMFQENKRMRRNDVACLLFLGNWIIYSLFQIYESKNV
jgi:hypothetical protein